jgi:hypothetical protein
MVSVRAGFELLTTDFTNQTDWSLGQIYTVIPILSYIIYQCYRYLSCGRFHIPRDCSAACLISLQRDNLELIMKTIDWSDKVATDFRSRIIVEPDSPILAFKASRDRYKRGTQPSYAGLPYLGSQASEDALTWNVFRSLQKANRLDIICKELDIGSPRGMLLWALAPETDDVNAELQYQVGTLIRKFDGILPGQVTKPDVIMLGSSGVAVTECKLSEREKPSSHLWEGSPDSVSKRLPIYLQSEANLLRRDVTREQIAEVYQLVRMAFYGLQLGKNLRSDPTVASLTNETNWHLEMRRLGKSPADLWDFFQYAVQATNLRKKQLTWQHLRGLIAGTSLDELSHYLSTHPCL